VTLYSEARREARFFHSAILPLMKLISWNVNGIRAGFKKDTLKQAFEMDADIIALQETKCEISQLTPEQLSYYGYTSVFESARNRKGYSGVAVYTRLPFTLLHATMNKKDFYDEEGRTLVLEFEKFYFINCYFPNGGKSDEHYLYKLDYYDHFLALAKKLEKKKPVIFTGDINATNEDIDLARPKENKDKLGCTKPERDRLKNFTDNFVDTYRHANGQKVQYTWWDMKTRSREKNVGWRIDYFYASASLSLAILKAEIHDDIFGSDHCPISLTLNIPD
jgi:exodeoxyribonuclease-3